MEQTRGGINITAIVISPWETNCYFIINEQTHETVIVDPASDAPVILEKCAELGLKPAAVMLTHGHFDHISAAREVKEAFGIPIYAGSGEKALLADAAMNCSSLAGGAVEITADIWLDDADVINAAGLDITVISTPGHTAGSVCYYLKDHNALISGDTLFKDGIGRTDLPTGDYTALIHSIRQKLFALPKETAVYPGHGGKTSVAREMCL